MTAILRITPREAHDLYRASPYEEPERFPTPQLEGAMSIQEFRPQGASLPRDQEIIFRCASPNEESAASQAAKSIAAG